jgi:hypothetical protein
LGVDGNSLIEFPKRRVSTPPPPPSVPTHVGDVNITRATPGRRSLTYPKTPQPRSSTSRHLKTGQPPILSPIPKTATGTSTTKKWARSTAHIHEVKLNAPKMMTMMKALQLDTNNVNANVRVARSGSSRTASPLRTHVPTTFITTSTSIEGKDRNGSDDVDSWVDTDDTASDVEFIVERNGTRRSFLVAAAS